MYLSVIYHLFCAISATIDVLLKLYNLNLSAIVRGLPLQNSETISVKLNRFVKTKITYKLTINRPKRQQNTEMAKY
ncbi:hypothetical protein BpHYR1_044580 [Brachionus plicatilis]|uniref:Uncharacterized protein n=1 Tax=Brachionus plicatilis TaxID=10195 RepID=A0A3M7RV66_BRAPC|nr:hypothetical protein BpHYR1_044580 [Brachionus plicatilis]